MFMINAFDRGQFLSKCALFRGDSSNVEVAFRCFGQAKTRLFLLGSKVLITLYNLVAGTGFEPVTFRL